MDQALRCMITDNNKDAKAAIEYTKSHFLSDATGSTLLHHSAGCGNEDVTQYLVDKGCDVNIQDIFGRTALMLAVMGNHEAIVNVLLTAKTDITIRNGDETVLNMVFTEPDVSIGIIRLFLIAVKQQFPTSEAAANSLVVAGCSLAQAILLGDSAKALIESMISLGSPVNSKNAHNRTALHSASAHGFLKIVKVLLKNGACPKALDDSKATPLYYLYLNNAKNSDEKLVILKIFLDSGVSLMSHTKKGIFQVSPVLSKGDREAIRAVLKSDVDFNARDKISGRSALHYMASNSNDGIVEELKLYSRRWNVNLVNNFQMNPLFGAVMNGNPDIVKYLLEQGSKVDLINSNDHFPAIFYAYAKSTTDSKDRYDQCAELLLQYNADPQIVSSINNEQVTLLDFALKENDFNRMKTVTAQIAIIKNLGIPINSVIRSKINSHRFLKRYFKECRKVLKKKIVHSKNILELLTDHKQKMAKYLDYQVIQKLNRLRIKNRVKIVYPYYFSILEKQCNMAKRYQEGASAICKIFGDQIGTDHLVIELIMNYLDDDDLQVLSDMYKERPLVANSSYSTVLALSGISRKQPISGTSSCKKSLLHSFVNM